MVIYPVPDNKSSSSDPLRSGARHRSGAASVIASGILSSRLMGLLREGSLAYFFGAGAHADVFRTALRAPNLLQNLLGEQTLSASFIPIYSRLLEDGREEEAGRFAGAIFGLLVAAASVLSIGGILLAKPLVALFAPGYLGDAAKVAAGLASVDRFPLAVAAVRWIFPMTGLLVLSAWALGILNSHRRFFLPYFAPVFWNASIIVALWVGGDVVGGILGWEAQAGSTWRDSTLLAACVGALIGGAIQFLVQVPLVLRLLRGFRISISTRVVGVSSALKAFAPLTAGRGAVQLSSYLDQFLASFLAAGALAALGWASVLYLLPVSLFGMSVAAAELPELSRSSEAETAHSMAARVQAGLRQMYFLTVPAFVGYLIFGFLIVGGLYRRGSFRLDDNWLVYLVLVGYTLGLLATNTSRLFNNVFFARGQTKIPARIAIERVVLSAFVGGILMVLLDRVSLTALVGMSGGSRDLHLGAVGLAVAAGIASWYEYFRLRARMKLEAPEVKVPMASLARMLASALLAAAPALAAWKLAPEIPLFVQAILVVGIYGLTYLVLARVFGVSEGDRWLGSRFRRG